MVACRPRLSGADAAVFVDSEARLFAPSSRYAELAPSGWLKDELEARGIKSQVPHERVRHLWGGTIRARCALPDAANASIGEIVHKEQFYPGEHANHRQGFGMWFSTAFQHCRPRTPWPRTRQPSLSPGCCDGDGNG